MRNWSRARWKWAVKSMERGVGGLRELAGAAVFVSEIGSGRSRVLSVSWVARLGVLPCSLNSLLLLVL
jgi:hypothetical protein